MTDYDKLEERRQMARSNYYAQMAMMGYGSDRNALDLVKVVRCRDCEFYGEEPIGTLKECYRGCGWTEPNDYCSRGKRRESE